MLIFGSKKFLVTGNASGLGLHVSSVLRLNGAEVIGLGRGQADFSSLESVCEAVRCAEDFSSLESVCEAVRYDRPYDGIVHCAGKEVLVPLRMTSNDHWDACMAAATSAFGILKAASKKGLMKSGGSIVLMSSVAAQRGTPGLAAYSASKGAIESMVRSAAVELAPDIRVNAVAAGAFESPMHQRIMQTIGVLGSKTYQDKHPLGIGTMKAVSDAILFLLSDDARWITGSVMNVDGGFAAR